MLDGAGDRVGATVGGGAVATLGRWRVAARVPDAVAVADAPAETLVEALAASELTTTDDGDGAGAPRSLPAPYM